MTLQNPKFLTKNKISTSSSISAFGGASQLTRLIDRNEDTKWYSTGDTTTPWTIVWTPDFATSINRIFVQGVNWATFTIKYNTSSDFSTAITATGSAETDFYFEFNAVSVTNVTITITALQGTDTLASASQIYCGTEYFTISSSTGGNKEAIASAAQRIIQMADGTNYKIFIRSNRNYRLDLIAVSETERTNFYNLYQTNRREPFVFIPNPDTDSSTWDGVAHHVNWINGFDFDNYYENLQANGRRAVVELSQTGGIG
jgi:hypothetical protein